MAQGVYSWLQYVQSDGTPSEELPLGAAVGLITAGTIGDETLVWSEGMDNWYPLVQCMGGFAWPGGDSAPEPEPQQQSATELASQQSPQLQNPSATVATPTATGEPEWTADEVVALESSVAASRLEWSQLGDDELLEILDVQPSREEEEVEKR
jgi:hypothetical protein